MQFSNFLFQQVNNISLGIFNKQSLNKKMAEVESKREHHIILIWLLKYQQDSVTCNHYGKKQVVLSSTSYDKSESRDR